MNVDTGQIYTDEEMKKLVEGLAEVPKFDTLSRVMEMEVLPTEKQMKRNPPKVGRNEPCPCGSEVKFKKCCLGRRPVNAIAHGW